jgi:hypothetical protein
MGQVNAVTNFYVRLSKQLGCAPEPQFLRCLLGGAGGVCKLSGAFTHTAASAIGSVLPHAGFKEINLSGMQLVCNNYILTNSKMLLNC